jgi:hypothetical protein
VTPVLSLQEKIVSLEKEILRHPQQGCPMRHWLQDGYYYRAIFIAKGMLITGARHRLEHECLCLGDLLVSTDVGMKRLRGYTRLWAEAGKKRIGLALEDTIWLTIHWTNRESLDEIEEWLSFPEEHKALAAVRERDKSLTLRASNVRQLFPTTEHNKQ